MFSHAPTTTECTVPPHLFRVLLLERLQLPLPLTEATCNGCHERLDPLGRHRGACTRSGRVKKRASPTERMLARVCREAGARVKFNAYLRDMFALLQRGPVGNRHYPAECSRRFWGAPTSSRRGGRGSACPGSPREGGHIPGAVDLEAMPTGRGQLRPEGDGATRRQNFFGSLHWPRHARHLLCWLTLLHSPGSAGGRGCSERPAQLPSLNRWLHQMSPTRGVRQEE